MLINKRPQRYSQLSEKNHPSKTRRGPQSIEFYCWGNLRWKGSKKWVQRDIAGPKYAWRNFADLNWIFSFSLISISYKDRFKKWMTHAKVPTLRCVYQISSMSAKSFLKYFHISEKVVRYHALGLYFRNCKW